MGAWLLSELTTSTTPQFVQILWKILECGLTSSGVMVASYYMAYFYMSIALENYGFTAVQLI